MCKLNCRTSTRTTRILLDLQGKRKHPAASSLVLHVLSRIVEKRFFFPFARVCHRHSLSMSPRDKPCLQRLNDWKDFLWQTRVLIVFAELLIETSWSTSSRQGSGECLNEVLLIRGSTDDWQKVNVAENSTDRMSGMSWTVSFVFQSGKDGLCRWSQTNCNQSGKFSSLSSIGLAWTNSPSISSSSIN